MNDIEEKTPPIGVKCWIRHTPLSEDEGDYGTFYYYETEGWFHDRRKTLPLRDRIVTHWRIAQ